MSEIQGFGGKMKSKSYLYTILILTSMPSQDSTPNGCELEESQSRPDWVMPVTLLNLEYCDRSLTKTGTTRDKRETEAQELVWA